MSDRRSQLMALLSDSGIAAKDGERNIMVCCPLAPYTPHHARLRDSRPSMGIKYTEFGGFVVNCFTCGYRAPSLSALYDELSLRSSDSSYMAFVDRAVALEQLDEDGVLSLLSTLDDAKGKQDDPIIDESEYAPFIQQKPHWYWGDRGIRPEIVSIWEGGFDPTLSRITIPVRCRRGHLRGATGRTTTQTSPVKYHNYWDMRRGRWLLGEHLVKGRVIIVVEGPLDALMVYQHLHDLGLLEDYSVVSLMGAKFTRHQADMICRIATEVVAFFDRDETGKQASENLINALMGRSLVSVVKYGMTEEKDPGSLPRDVFYKLLCGASLI